MNYLNIKMPYPMPDDYNIELDALSEIVCKLPSCEELLKILEKEYAE